MAQSSNREALNPKKALPHFSPAPPAAKGPPAPPQARRPPAPRGTARPPVSKTCLPGDLPAILQAALASALASLAAENGLPPLHPPPNVLDPPQFHTAASSSSLFAPSHPLLIELNRMLGKQKGQNLEQSLGQSLGPQPSSRAAPVARSVPGGAPAGPLDREAVLQAAAGALRAAAAGDSGSQAEGTVVGVATLLARLAREEAAATACRPAAPPARQRPPLAMIPDESNRQAPARNHPAAAAGRCGRPEWDSTGLAQAAGGGKPASALLPARVPSQSAGGLEGRQGAVRRPQGRPGLSNMGPARRVPVPAAGPTLAAPHQARVSSAARGELERIEERMVRLIGMVEGHLARMGPEGAAAAESLTAQLSATGLAAGCGSARAEPVASLDWPAAAAAAGGSEIADGAVGVSRDTLELAAMLDRLDTLEASEEAARRRWFPSDAAVLSSEGPDVLHGQADPGSCSPRGGPREGPLGPNHTDWVPASAALGPANQAGARAAFSHGLDEALMAQGCPSARGNCPSERELSSWGVQRGGGQGAGAAGGSGVSPEMVERVVGGQRAFLRRQRVQDYVMADVHGSSLHTVEVRLAKFVQNMPWNGEVLRHLSSKS